MTSSRRLDVGLSPAQAAIRSQIEEHARVAMQERTGQVVVVTGREGSGKTELLRDLLARPPRSTRVVSNLASPAATRATSSSVAAEAAGGAMATGAMVLNPAIAIGENVLRLGLVAAERLGRGGTPDLPGMLPMLLRAAAEEKPKAPLVCLVDDAETLQASWWAHLQFAFAHEIAEQLPLVLVLVVDAASLDPNEASEVGPAMAVESLISRELAVSSPLADLGIPDVERWLGSAPREVVERALRISGGASGTLAELWASWAQRQVIRRDELGNWRLAQPLRATLDDVGEALTAKLTRAAEEQPAVDLEAIRRLVGCAALEGTSFTADAVALTLGWDRDVLLDLLDETVADGSADAIMEEEAAVTIRREDGSTAHLWRYRFRSLLERRLAAERLLSAGEKRTLAASMARAVADLHHPVRLEIAHRVARLLKVAGDQENAERWTRVSDLGASRTALDAVCELLLTETTDDWTKSDYASGARLLVARCKRFRAPDSYDYRIRVAEQAERFARAGEVQIPRLQALGYQGEAHAEAGLYDRARECLRACVDESAIGAPRVHLSGMRALVELEVRAGDRKAARSWAEKALAGARAIHHRHDEASALHVLGMVELTERNDAAAEQNLRAARAICKDMGARHDESVCLALLAGIAIRRKDFTEAETVITEALDISVEVDGPPGRSGLLRQYAEIEKGQGKLSAAMDRYEVVAALDHAEGHVAGEASALIAVSRLARQSGDLVRAKRASASALQLYRDDEYPVGEAAALGELAAIARGDGAEATAREYEERATELDPDGDRHEWVLAGWMAVPQGDAPERAP